MSADETTEAARILALVGKVEEGTAELPDDRSPREVKRDAILSKIITGADLLNIPEPEPLVSGLLFRETTAMLIGEPNSGKSFLAVDLAASVIFGRDWQGLHTYGKGRPVLYLTGEGRRGIMVRFIAWCDYHGHDVEELTRWLRVYPGGASLHMEEERWPIVDAARKVDPVLVIVDTLARHAQGAEENSARDMGRLVGTLDAIAEATTAHVFVVHHTGKDPSKGARGSSALLGAADTELTVHGSPPQATVKVTKQKDAEPLHPWQVRFDRAGTHPVKGGHLSLVAMVTTEPPRIGNASDARLIDALRSVDLGTGVTLRDWLDALNDGLPDGDDDRVTRSTLQRITRRLLDEGLVERTKVGKADRWQVVGPATDPEELPEPEKVPDLF